MSTPSLFWFQDSGEDVDLFEEPLPPNNALSNEASPADLTNKHSISPTSAQSASSPTKKSEKGTSSSAWHTFAAQGDVDPAKFMEALQGGRIARFMKDRFRKQPKSSVESSSIENDTGITTVASHEQSLEMGDSHIFSLTGTMPWTERMLLRGLQYNLGARNFKLYRKPPHPFTRDYFIAINRLPYDFCSELCIVGPQHRAGRKECGFYAEVEQIGTGACTCCAKSHDGQICGVAVAVDVDAILASDSEFELVSTSPRSSVFPQNLLD